MTVHTGLQTLRRLTLLLAATFLAGILIRPAHAMKVVDIDEELRVLRNGHAQVHIAGARYRFAVFTFEDPDGTGLGNALATLIAHELLMGSSVTSLGVLRYLGNLSKAADDKQLRYFDKVEPLIESQGVQVAIWGAIRRRGEGIRIDSFVQVSPSVVHKAFSYTLRLPRASGGGKLIHRVGPGRMLAQRLDLTAEEVRALGSQARELDRLRAAPSDVAAVTMELPLGKVYYLRERHGEWARVGIEGGGDGWIRAAEFCTSACVPLLTVAHFASGLMAYDELDHRIPERSAALAPDALVVIDQLRAIGSLNHAPADSAEQEALHILDPWCPPAPNGDAPSTAPAPGGAAACNLRAIATLVDAIRRSAQRDTAGVRLPEDLLRAVSERLARASLSDPRDLPTLTNLETLFRALGDAKRERLARELAGRATR